MENRGMQIFNLWIDLHEKEFKQFDLLMTPVSFLFYLFDNEV